MERVGVGMGRGKKNEGKKKEGDIWDEMKGGVEIWANLIYLLKLTVRVQGHTP